ncbi:MAG TPA: hypothetical protein VK094_03495 [Pseudogracilibacillus sp.]|nr:hypothetical protein [Pseudogracilibacillus sp.]
MKFIIVSDIELDSIGGLGVLLRSCPNAQVIAPTSFTHTLTQPKQIIAATRAIYGEHFSDNFEPIHAVDKEVIKEVSNKEKIDLGERALQFVIPENASFMLTYDKVRNQLYTGHALGVYYDQLQDDNVDLFLPSVPAALFDLDTYRKTITSIEQQNLNALYFNHFGKTEKVDLALNQLNHWLELFILLTKETITEKGNYNDLSSKLLTVVHHYLREQNIPDNHQIYQYIILDINTCALTLLKYFK